MSRIGPTKPHVEGTYGRVSRASIVLVGQIDLSTEEEPWACVVVSHFGLPNTGAVLEQYWSTTYMWIASKSTIEQPGDQELITYFA